MSDKNVRAVLINIFGGILRCDILAAGVIAAVQELGVRVPDRHPHGRHERRGRKAPAARERAQFHDGQLDGRGRSQVVSWAVVESSVVSHRSSVVGLSQESMVDSRQNDTTD